MTRAAHRERIEKVQGTIEAWAKRYPEAFSLDPKKIRPLKIGIRNELIAQGYDAAETGRALQWYATRTAYLTAIANGKRRRGLDGNKFEPATEQQRENARLILKQRRKKKPPQPPKQPAQQKASVQAAPSPAPPKPSLWPTLHLKKPAQANAPGAIVRK